MLNLTRMQPREWLLLATLGLFFSQVKGVKPSQENTQEFLEYATNLRSALLSSKEHNNSCILTGIKERRIDLFELLREPGSADDGLCSSVLEAPQCEKLRKSKTEMPPRLKNSILTQSNDYIQGVLDDLKKGNLIVTKDLVLGILNNVPYPIPTPDVITLSENVVKAISKPDLNVSRIEIRGNDVLEIILKGIIKENEKNLKPEATTQVLQLLSALRNIQSFPPSANLLLLIKPDEYPPDVIEARDKLLEGLDNGDLPITSNSWETPPKQLMSILTHLSATSYEHPLASSIHVVYTHYRLKYLSFEGYMFVPTNLTDIAFLLNSFLTIRSKVLIEQVYEEFSRNDFPWLELSSKMNYSEYSNPRKLLLDMLRTILQNPNSLNFCNSVLLNLFIHSDKADAPSWLRHIVPINQSDPNPIIELANVNHTIQETGKPPCSGKLVTIIDPEGIIEIIRNTSHAKFIVDILRNNTVKHEDYPYKTRGATFLAVLDDLKNKKYNDDVSEYVITQAIQRLALNSKKTLPNKLLEICENDLNEGTSDVPGSLNNEGPDEKKFNESPEETKSNEGPDEKKFNEGPEETKSNKGSDATKSNEVPASVESNEGSTTENSPVENECKNVTVINQQALLDSISDEIPLVLKNTIYELPICFSNYEHLNTNKEVLYQILIDRNKNILADNLKRILDKIQFNLQGDEPPEAEEVCEESLKSVIYEEIDPLQPAIPEPDLHCSKLKTVNPLSLIDIVEPTKSDILIKQVLFSHPILASKYNDNATRKDIFQSAMEANMKRSEKWQTAYIILNALANFEYNSKAQLAPEYLEHCPCPSNDVMISFVNPSSLKEILPQFNNELLREMIEAKPIIADFYTPYNDRGSVLKLLLSGWTREHGMETAEDILDNLSELKLNEKSENEINIIKRCVNKNIVPTPAKGHSELCPYMKIPVELVDPVSIFEIIDENDLDEYEFLKEKLILGMKYPNYTREKILEAELENTGIPMPDINEKSEWTPRTKTCCVDVYENALVSCFGIRNETDKSTTEALTPAKGPSIEDLFEEVDDGLGKEAIECATTEAVPTTSNFDLSTSEEFTTEALVETSTVSYNPLKNLRGQSQGGCEENEIYSPVAKIESLWTALDKGAPKAPYIRAKVDSYLVPIDLDKEYTRGEILRDILVNIREDIRDPRVLHNLESLMECIRLKGPGLLPPKIEYVCLPLNVNDDSGESEIATCKSDETLTSVVETESLFDALLPGAPKTPHILQLIGSYVVPLESDKTYTKGDVLRDILVNLREEVTDERVLKNLINLEHFIAKEGPALEEPDSSNMCIPTKSLDEAVWSKPEFTSSHTSTPSVYSTTNSPPTFLKVNHETTEKPLVKPTSVDLGDIVVLKPSSIVVLAMTKEPKVPTMPLIIPVEPISVDANTSISPPEPQKPISPEVPATPLLQQSTESSPTTVGTGISILPSEPQKPILPVMPATPLLQHSTESSPTTVDPGISILPSEPQKPISPEIPATPLLQQSTESSPTTVDPGISTLPSEPQKPISPEIPATPLHQQSTESSLPEKTTFYEPELTSGQFSSEEVSTTEQPQPLPETISEESEDCDLDDTPLTGSSKVNPQPTTTDSSASEECDFEDEQKLKETSPIVSKTDSDDTPEDCDFEDVTDGPTDTSATPTSLVEGVHKKIQKLAWPWLLKVVKDERCYDEGAKAYTFAVNMVNITDLIACSEGSEAAKYAATALLASPDTYYKLDSFDMKAYKTKAEFWEALTKHLGHTFFLEQNFKGKIDIVTLCWKDLVEILPSSGWRVKRSTNVEKNQEAKLRLEGAFQLLTNWRK